MKIVFALLLVFMSSLTSQPSLPVTVEIGPEHITTLAANQTGVRWIARGYVYPAGTFTPARPACELNVEVPAIGTYVIFGSVGNREMHAGQYVVRIAAPNQPLTQYSFGGLIEYLEDQDGVPQPGVFSAGMIQSGQIVAVGEGIEASYTPRSRQCFGGTVEVRPVSIP